MNPILYIKPGCPWCNDALAFFKQKGLQLTVKDVLSDANAMRRMRDISGQTKTPTLEYGDFVVADFDTGEFMAAVNKNPGVKAELGL